jgi:hypothetical protein
VELREAEPLGVLDDHDGRVRHVDADFDDGGRHERIEAMPGEVAHHRLLVARLEPAVQQAEPER